MGLPRAAIHVLDGCDNSSGGYQLRQIDDHRDALGMDLSFFRWHVPNCMDFSSAEIEER
jgi:hypothetical protein